jgi:hypothetical protein
MTADLNNKAAGYVNLDALNLLIPSGNKVLFASELNVELNVAKRVIKVHCVLLM